MRRLSLSRNTHNSDDDILNIWKNIKIINQQQQTGENYPSIEGLKKYLKLYNININQFKKNDIVTFIIYDYTFNYFFNNIISINLNMDILNFIENLLKEIKSLEFEKSFDLIMDLINQKKDLIKNLKVLLKVKTNSYNDSDYLHFSILNFYDSIEKKNSKISIDNLLFKNEEKLSKKDLGRILNILGDLIKSQYKIKYNPNPISDGTHFIIEIFKNPEKIQTNIMIKCNNSTKNSSQFCIFKDSLINNGLLRYNSFINSLKDLFEKIKEFFNISNEEKNENEYKLIYKDIQIINLFVDASLQPQEKNKKKPFNNNQQINYYKYKQSKEETDLFGFLKEKCEKSKLFFKYQKYMRDRTTNLFSSEITIKENFKTIIGPIIKSDFSLYDCKVQASYEILISDVFKNYLSIFEINKIKNIYNKYLEQKNKFDEKKNEQKNENKNEQKNENKNEKKNKKIDVVINIKKYYI